MKFFAYGSNMLTRRLRAPDRCPDAKYLSTATLAGYALRFHKISGDGSGKCNAVKTGNAADVVHGALFEVNTANKSQLGKAEGLGKGYQESGVQVVSPEGTVSAFTFLADPDAIDETLKPYDWYVDLVIAGAKEHNLPADYIEMLNRVESIKDTNDARIKSAIRYLY
jgi:hypothetical protein